MQQFFAVFETFMLRKYATRSRKSFVYFSRQNLDPIWHRCRRPGEQSKHNLWVRERACRLPPPTKYKIKEIYICIYIYIYICFSVSSALVFTSIVSVCRLLGNKTTVLASCWVLSQNCEKLLLVSSRLSVRPHGTTPTVRIFTKFGIWVYFKILSWRLNFD